MTAMIGWWSRYFQNRTKQSYTSPVSGKTNIAQHAFSRFIPRSERLRRYRLGRCARAAHLSHTVLRKESLGETVAVVVVHYGLKCVKPRSHGDGTVAAHSFAAWGNPSFFTVHQCPERTTAL